MTVYGICEKGNYREENQDSILMRCEGNSGLFIVADGVGGCTDGAKASRYITQTYGRWWEEVFLGASGAPFFSYFDYIKSLAEQINKDICRQYGVGNCCSTIVLLFVHEGIYGYLSVGDSRIYRCGRGGMKLITRDDVWENRPDADASSNHVGKIISAIGGYDVLEYSSATDRACARDVFMLCSDGIYRYVKEKFLLAAMKRIHRIPFFQRGIVEDVVRQAVDNDTKDNYSVIVLKI